MKSLKPGNQKTRKYKKPGKKKTNEISKQNQKNQEITKKSK